MNGVDHLTDIGQLKGLNPGVEREHLVVDDRGDPNVIDVVGGIERMPLNVVGSRSQVKAEAFEKHD